MYSGLFLANLPDAKYGDFRRFIMKILDEPQIKQKIKRLAIEILEQHYDAKQIILAGINNNGVHFAKLIGKALKKISDIPLRECRIKLNPANPLASEIKVDIPIEEFNDQDIIVVDDVANTGRTIFYAMQPLMEVLAHKIQVAVLIDRKHKSFPIAVDYVGLSLSTTLMEDIDVRIRDVKTMEVHLH